VVEADKLLADSPGLAVSLHRRNDYLGPLNFIQADLLKSIRKSEELGQENPVMQPLLRSINAIAAGMRNTG
jgi:phosphoenolpyruvate carboxylase